MSDEQECPGCKHGVNSCEMTEQIEHACSKCQWEFTAHELQKVSDSKDRQISELKAELEAYKDCYDPVKSGLRQDEEHCACAYELQEHVKKLRTVIKELGGELKQIQVTCGHPDTMMGHILNIQIVAEALSNPIVKEIMESER